MCGIAGYIGTRRVSDEQATDCLKRMHHRGPDGQGIFRHTREGRHCLLLHTRLAILDLDERAAQPMRYASRVMAFNGELYNYLEVKKSLETLGESFATTSDTEVLLRQLVVHGPTGLDGCEGMWSFALYNEMDGSLLISRDRFGEKPLYLYKDETGLYFGSEIKFLSALSGRRFSADPSQIHRFLVNGYKSLYKQPKTFFLEVSELEPASCLSVPNDKPATMKRYWNPDFKTCVEPMTFEQAVAGTRERLIRSVELRLRADVPLAFCMSGGVDSNALIAIARRVLNYDVHGFTIVNTDKRYDEWDLVQASVNELGIKHTAIPVRTDDFLENLRALVRAHDAPVYTITYYAHWLLMRAIREQGYKVSVSGTAADELFSGYYDHYAMHLAALHSTPGFADALAEWKRHVAPVVRNPVLQDPEVFINNPKERSHIYLQAEDFTARLTEPFQEPFFEQDYTPDLLRNRMLNELFHEAVPVILHEDDLNAMYFSIENRSPFLDRDLFEFTLRIPTGLLIQDGYNKAVLRQAMRGIVPDAILNNRPKVGFNAPILSFLNIQDPAVRGQLFADSPIFDHVSKNAIEAVTAREELPNSESKYLFSFLNTKMFLEECC